VVSTVKTSGSINYYNKATADKDVFSDFMKSENIPIHTGYSVDQLTELEVSHWKRFGTNGAFIRLVGAMTLDAGYVLYFEPGSSLNPQSSISDEMVLVLEGSGKTDIWYQGSAKKYTIDWKKYTTFKLPQNACYQHHSSTAAKLFTVTSLPLIVNTLGNLDIVFTEGRISEFWKNELEAGKFKPDVGKISENKELIWSGYVISDVSSFDKIDSVSRWWSTGAYNMGAWSIHSY
jgi:hypothetical protein